MWVQWNAMSGIKRLSGKPSQPQVRATRTFTTPYPWLQFHPFLRSIHSLIVVESTVDFFAVCRRSGNNLHVYHKIKNREIASRLHSKPLNCVVSSTFILFSLDYSRCGRSFFVPKSGCFSCRLASSHGLAWSTSLHLSLRIYFALSNKPVWMPAFSPTSTTMQ